jgi:hypothetical protein
MNTMERAPTRTLICIDHSLRLLFQRIEIPILHFGIAPVPVSATWMAPKRRLPRCFFSSEGFVGSLLFLWELA